MEQPLLEVDHVTMQFGGLVALGDVDFSIAQGEILGLIGPNGAGKTTLVMHMNGIHPTTHGSVHVAGQLVDAKDKESLKQIRSKVGIVFQDPDDQLAALAVSFGAAHVRDRGDPCGRCRPQRRHDPAHGVVGRSVPEHDVEQHHCGVGAGHR